MMHLGRVHTVGESAAEVSEGRHVAAVGNAFEDLEAPVRGSLGQ
ncbi:hypothetical protein ABZY45_12765 [Streptomyces sp. NPDC006516]